MNFVPMMDPVARAFRESWAVLHLDPGDSLDIVHRTRSSLTSQWPAGRNPWTPLALSEAVAGLGKTVEKRIRITGAEAKTGVVPA
jgi:hypothetical protein